jgi:hypothetical protein
MLIFHGTRFSIGVDTIGGRINKRKGLPYFESRIRFNQRANEHHFLVPVFQSWNFTTAREMSCNLNFCTQGHVGFTRSELNLSPHWIARRRIDFF